MFPLALLENLLKYQDDSILLGKFLNVKQQRKQVLANYIKEQNINVPDGLYKAEIFNFKIFGKTLFSIKESTKSKYVFMFGKINIFKY